MAIRISVPRMGVGNKHGVMWRVLAITLVGLVVIALAGLAVFGFYYHKYGVVVDQRLEKPLFVNTAQIYAAARQVRTGQKLTAATVAQQLRAAGYTDDSTSSPTQAQTHSPMGTFAANQNSITIRPGPQSFHAPEDATITFDSEGARGVSRVQQITATDGQQLASYALEPLLITGLSDQTRTKRRLITYDELPKYLVPAVTSIEDRHFFSHGGVDYIRIVGAMRNDLLRRRLGQGGSTLTMQLARGFFLTPAKHFKRKLLEIMITWHLESRFNKQQIFQMYANQIPLGQAGSFAINGFGEAAQVYFGKDVSKLNLQECALLAGMIQSPSRLNPLRHPVHAVERRNLVLDQMVETGAISKAEAEDAKASPLKLAPVSVQQDQAPYFVDLVRDQIAAKLGDANWNQQGLRIYTSLDPQLQGAASAAVEAGIKHVDELVDRRHAKAAAAGEPVVYPQVALVALDPHTGQVLALVGGRNYGQSQLNHAVAHRPTGSIFKPFVYASAFNSSLAGTQLTTPDGATGVFTPAMLLPNDQQTFEFGNGQSYTPRNYRDKYQDEITAQYALKESENNATVALAQMVGFGNVAALARDAGIVTARATPSVALGAYDATPLEMAGAYTAFANGGAAIKPWMLASIRTSNGDPVQDFSAQMHPVLDPRVAYLTTNMMEAVMNSGSGIGTRQLGFTSPAAGKTGTSGDHDAWFAGYTSNLICIVWVGNDDYSTFNLTGAQAALPIWTEFMKRAVALPQYSDAHEFPVPSGVTLVRLDKATNLLADTSCPDDYTAAFLDGTAPLNTCDQAGNDQRNIFQKIFGIGHDQSNAPQQGQPALPGMPPQSPALQTQQGANASPATPNGTQPQVPQPAQEKKPGFFGKLFGHKPKQDQQPPQ